MKLLDTFTTSSQSPITVQGKTKLNVHFDVFEFTENYLCFRETERAARMFLSSNPPPPPQIIWEENENKVHRSAKLCQHHCKIKLHNYKTFTMGILHCDCPGAY